MPDTTIRILPEHLANQIAAGEVVQRPESIVKELVENSIDSGAESISVVVREAGKQLIHVLDDGGGMSKSDLEMCTVRHATSKIVSEDDLYSIKTLGFRGEALSSVAAVADVEIRTRRDGDNNAWTLTSRPGSNIEIRASNSEQGTQVLVRNLFYNVPARRKFLKSDLTEFRYISETMQRLTLSRPDLRFTFHDGDTLVFNVKPANVKKRIIEILSIADPKTLIHVEGSEGGVSIEGYAGLPSMSRQSRSGQYLFLNHRPIFSRSLSHAVSSAYEHLLNIGQHAVFVIYITIDPNDVDVNVHPQKHEVKFEDERLVYLLLQHVVTSALGKANVIPSFLSDVPLSVRPLQSLSMQSGTGPTIVNRLTGEILPSVSSWSSSDFRGETVSRREHESVGELFARVDTGGPDVMQIGMQYVVATSAEGLVIIDQHAAHERIIFERVIQHHSQEAHKGQALLFSVRIRLAPSRFALLREYLDDLSSLGFRIDADSNSTVEIHAVPNDVKPGNEESVLDEILQALEDHGRLPREHRIDGIAAAFASIQAVKRGEKLNNDELRSLARDLFQCSLPHLTPDGRPTYIVVPFDELVQRFR